MFRSRTSNATLIAAITLAVGMGAGLANADPSVPSHDGTTPVRKDARDRDTTKTTTTRAKTPGQLVFVPADKMLDMDVYNANHESFGAIDDLVIERGSGRITHAVVSTGTTMGLGGKTVLVPYSHFTWDATRKHLMVNTTAEDMKAWPEFDKDRWANDAKNEKSVRYSIDSGYYRPANATQLESKAENRRIKGEIKNVDRVADSTGSENVVVTVVTDGNRQEKVVIGPSWYLAGNSITFFRGTPVDLDVAYSDNGTPATVVARSVSANSKDVSLYDKDGWPMWYETTPGAAPVPMSDRGRVRSDWSAGSSPLVLATELEDSIIDCRSDNCGKVDDLIIECKSGRVAFVSIDPDDTVLGIGDTMRLIPWSVVTPTADDRIVIDATKAMIVSAQELPSDYEAFFADGNYKRVYTSFDVPVAEFTDNSVNR